MANVNKITPLIFLSSPQASSRRGSAKLKINVDLETTEAFCLGGLRFFSFFLFQPSSHLAQRLVIFPRIKLSWWNKAEGRQWGRAVHWAFGCYHSWTCLTDKMRFSRTLSFSVFCLCALSCPSVYSLLYSLSPFPPFHLNSITKPFSLACKPENQSCWQIRNTPVICIILSLFHTHTLMFFQMSGASGSFPHGCWFLPVDIWYSYSVISDVFLSPLYLSS